MLTINSFVLYVENIHVSQTFYSRLFDWRGHAFISYICFYATFP